MIRYIIMGKFRRRSRRRNKSKEGTRKNGGTLKLPQFSLFKRLDPVGYLIYNYDKLEDKLKNLIINNQTTESSDSTIKLKKFIKENPGVITEDIQKATYLETFIINNFTDEEQHSNRLNKWDININAGDRLMGIVEQYKHLTPNYSKAAEFYKRAGFETGEQTALRKAINKKYPTNEEKKERVTELEGMIAEIEQGESSSFTPSDNKKILDYKEEIKLIRIELQTELDKRLKERQEGDGRGYSWEEETVEDEPIDWDNPDHQPPEPDHLPREERLPSLFDETSRPGLSRSDGGKRTRRRRKTKRSGGRKRKSRAKRRRTRR